MCVLKGKPIAIGMEISREYVRYAEEIADISYSQAETFSSALLHPSSGPTYSIGKPKLPVRVKVIQALIRSAGKVVNVRTIVKNIRDKATENNKRYVLHHLDVICMNISNRLRTFTFFFQMSWLNYLNRTMADMLTRKKWHEIKYYLLGIASVPL